MIIETFDLKEFYLKKSIPYFLMFCTLFCYGFPFKFPHNTYNWIQKFDLPEYTYPVFILLFIIFFISMIISFFSDTVISKIQYDLTSGVLIYKGSSYRFNEMLNYKLEGRFGLTIENKTVWKFNVVFKDKSISLFLLLSFAEKKEFQNYLEKYN